MVTLPNGTQVNELRLRFKVKVDFHCNRQVVELEDEEVETGEEGTREAARCLGTLLAVDVEEPVTFSIMPGGNAITPVAQRTWWESSERFCDGRDRSARLEIAYFGRYPNQGVPRKQGGVPADLVLNLQTKDGAGPDYQARFRFNQNNQQANLGWEFISLEPI